MKHAAKTGVLAMAYGSPERLDDIGPYLRDIRAGRDVSDASIAELRSRYEAAGGVSPLNRITNAQAQSLQQRLDERAPGEFVVGVGMKHWKPPIADALERMLREHPEVQSLIGLALAPHYSRMGIGGYAARVHAALPAQIPFHMIESWYSEPSFVSFMATQAQSVMQSDDDCFLFTAHSLPASIIDQGDPYLEQLTDSAKLVAAQAGIAHFEVCFQSASSTGVPWLGPDLCERIDALASSTKRIVVVPIGFVSDHLEILFDIDVEAAAAAKRSGVELVRTQLPNEAPAFIDALADVVMRAERERP